MTSFYALHSSYLPSPPTTAYEACSPSFTQYMLRGIIDRVRRSRSNSTAGSELDEASRLQLLHIAHTAVLNPRHAQTIDSYLASVHGSGRRSTVLDVGAGTGTWAINLANTQPFADVTAVDWDWSWFQPSDPINGNLDFQTIDISQTLPFPAGAFDLIHVKCVTPCLSRYAALIERLAVILRPGGMLVLVESELGYSSSGPMSTSMRTWNACIAEALAGKGTDLPAVNVQLPSQLVSCIAQSGVFSSAVYNQEAAVHGASAGQGEDLACAGRLHPTLVAASLDRQMSELIQFGYGRDQLCALRDEVYAEMASGHSGCGQRIYAAYATKSY